MGFTFRKRIKIAPGVTLNVSRSGASTSIGPRGARVTVGGRRGPRATISVPGTGISYSQSLKVDARPPAPPRGSSGFWPVLLVAAVVVSLLMHFLMK